MLERHLGKQKLSIDVLGTWLGYLKETLDEVMLEPFMMEPGLLAGWLSSTLATFRADFFLRNFIMK